MGSENLHEDPAKLSRETQDLHRAIVSLVEELEAVDWYTQRAEASDDAELREILGHHRDEEIEHAMMNLEWIRRRHAKFDHDVRTYLLSTGKVIEAEEGAKAEVRTPLADSETTSARADGSLGIGSLR